MSLSEEKQFALEVLDIFDELAQPEIKNRVFHKIWDYVKGYTHKVLLKKPDKEINDKMLVVYRKLHTRFKDLDMSIEMNLSEAMGSVKIPDVGELAKKKQLTTISKEQAQQLMEELF